MKNKPLKTIIPNWTMFGADRIVVNIFKKEVDGEIFYTSALLFWLNDGSSEEEYAEKTVTIFTDVVTNDPKQSALILGEYASALFNEVDSIAYVFDEDDKVIEEIDMNELEDEDLPEINLEDFGLVETHKKVIH